MQAAPKNGHCAAQRATRRLRGKVIEHFAEVEYAVGAVLVRAATLPEYHAPMLEFPRHMTQKRERLCDLMNAEGPLRSRAVEIIPLLKEFREFDPFRNLMAHGIVEQNGERSYVFRMICSDVQPDSSLPLTHRDFQRRTDKLAKIATELASKLEAIADSMDKLPTYRTAKNGR